MKKIIAFITIIGLASCDPSGVKKTDLSTKDSIPEIAQIDSAKAFVSSLDDDAKVVDEKRLANGITIKWYEHGSGEKVQKNEVINVDYKVLLSDGEVIDGNHLLKKNYVPFMVGFGMQTKGWDIALEELKVGDYAEIFIPSKLARGDQEVKGLFPKNSDNILKIRVIEKPSPTRTRDGNKIWVFEESELKAEKFGEDNEVSFHCMGFTPTNPIFINTYRSNQPFTLKLEDNGLVPGLKKALINAKKGDRMLVYVPASEAYKSKGYLDVVKPNEDIMYNILVLDVSKE